MAAGAHACYYSLNCQVGLLRWKFRWLLNLCIQARCIQAVVGDTERHRFVVGTTQLATPNALHVLEFHEETNDLVCVDKYQYEKEIWNLAPHPFNASLILISQKKVIGLYEMTTTLTERTTAVPSAGGHL